VAAEFGHLEALTYLLQSAADVEAVNMDGDTPLHMAALGAHLPCVSKLVEYGAKANALNRCGTQRPGVVSGVILCRIIQL
jgi:ankyrin repeat protein